MHGNIAGSVHTQCHFLLAHVSWIRFWLTCSVVLCRWTHHTMTRCHTSCEAPWATTRQSNTSWRSRGCWDLTECHLRVLPPQHPRRAPASRNSRLRRSSRNPSLPVTVSNTRHRTITVTPAPRGEYCTCNLHTESEWQETSLGVAVYTNYGC